MADFKSPGPGWRRATRREAIESGDYIHYNFTNEGASAVYWVPISTKIGQDSLSRSGELVMAEQQTDARRAAVNHLTTRFTAQALASVIVDALAIAGADKDWDDADDVLIRTVGTFASLGLPSPEHPRNVAYWRSVTGEEN